STIGAPASGPAPSRGNEADTFANCTISASSRRRLQKICPSVGSCRAGGRRSIVLGMGLVIVLFGLAHQTLLATDSISLGRKLWRFALDRADAGISEQWFNRDLAYSIDLPGVLQSQGYGDEISISTPWVLSLYDKQWFLRDDYQAY